MIRIYVILIGLFNVSCGATTQSYNSIKKDHERQSKVYFSKEFSSQDNLYRLDIVQGDSTYIERADLLLYPCFVFYRLHNGHWEITYKKDFDNPEHNFELNDDSLVSEINGLVIIDINDDGIMEFFCRNDWVSGSFPPYSMFTSTKDYDTLINVEIDRFPVFYPKYKILSISSGRVGKDEQTDYYTFDYASKQLVEISDSFRNVMINDTLQEEIIFSSITIVD